MAGMISNALGLNLKKTNTRKKVRVIFDMTAGTVQTIDFVPSIRGLDDGVFTVYVDNSLNSAGINLIFTGASQQNIFVPANMQGVWPVLMDASDKVEVQAISSGAVAVPVEFLNFFLPPNQWSSVPAGTVVGTVVVSGTVTADQPKANMTERSGTITVGGTSQVLAAVNAARRNLIIQNPATIAGQNIAALESIFIRFANAAGVYDGTSLEILPGGYFDFASRPVDTRACNINAATTGHRFIAMEQ